MAVKKLIEVALPLDAINAASTREKSLRHGHPSTLHLWWARRPLAAARAVLWASLVDDPSGHPEVFPTEKEQNQERERLFRILEELVIWENSNNIDVLNRAKAEIRKSVGNEMPAMLDPFAGGGAIPLEAQRLGLEAHAHDLNPVAVTINKAMIEIPPRFAGRVAINPESQKRKSIDTWEGNSGLAADVEYYGLWIKEEAFRRIGHLFPKVNLPQEFGGEKANVVAWLWARTVKCPNPACGCQMPLIRSRVVSRRKKYFVDPVPTDGEVIEFVVKHGDVCGKSQTVSRSGATCIKCGNPVKLPYIREMGKTGQMSYSPLAVVAEGKRGKAYLSWDDSQDIHLDEYDHHMNLGQLATYPGYINPPAYGLETIESLFTNRQLIEHETFCSLIIEVKKMIVNDAIIAGYDHGDSLASGSDQAEAYADAVSVYLALVIDRLIDRGSAICGWDPSADKMRNTFGLVGMSMSWHFAEANPFSNSSGCFDNALSWVVKCIRNFPTASPGIVNQLDAQTDSGLRNAMVSTDPPYYSNVAYADFSDFFYVWLRKTLRVVYPNLYSTMLTPKTEELVADPHRDGRGITGARDFFELGMFDAIKQIYKCSRDDIPVTIYYAFKQTEKTTSNDIESSASTGWETMLSAIVRAGFQITGTWPMRTELANRTRSNSSNALASSIVLVCRKRPADAPMATRRDFVSVLKRELKPALDKLQTSNIAPVDLAQSAIGPGIGVYSRFSKVLEADGTEMTVRSALQIINQELDLYFSDQDNDLDRESRFCVDLYTQNAFNEIRFGEADVLARAKNTSIEGIAAKGALSSAKGVVRLLGRDEIRDMPAPDFCWLFTQQLTHAMETGGIEECAKMLKDIYDGRADNARALAYRLFTIADKKGWNQEAFAYNSLVVAWRDIESRTAQLKQETPVQTSLDI